MYDWRIAISNSYKARYRKCVGNMTNQSNKVSDVVFIYGNIFVLQIGHVYL